MPVLPVLLRSFFWMVSGGAEEAGMKGWRGRRRISPECGKARFTRLLRGLTPKVPAEFCSAYLTLFNCGLPDSEEVHQGCIAYKIAAHAGDIARHHPGARDRDDAMSRARADFDWNRQFELCLDPERAKARWLKTRAFTDEVHDDDHCSMCGKQFCAVRTSRRIRKLAAEQ